MRSSKSPAFVQAAAAIKEYGWESRRTCRNASSAEYSRVRVTVLSDQHGCDGRYQHDDQSIAPPPGLSRPSRPPRSVTESHPGPHLDRRPRISPRPDLIRMSFDVSTCALRGPRHASSSRSSISLQDAYRVFSRRLLGLRPWRTRWRSLREAHQLRHGSPCFLGQLRLRARWLV